MTLRTSELDVDSKSTNENHESVRKGVMPTDIRVLIADDHPVFRHGLQQVVEQQPDMHVVEAVGEGAAALDAIRRLLPDVAVLDVRMPGLGGFEVATQLADEGLPTRLMFLTMHDEPVLFERALAIGVKGYVLKDAALSEIVQAVRAVAIGRTYLSPALSQYLVERSFPSTRARPVGASPLAELSARERHILRLIAESRTSKEIADTLGLHYRTVENLRAAMSQKLGLQGSHALVRFAFQHKAEL
jgi:DNA-binding NarL/FixJ family response regulator